MFLKLLARLASALRRRKIGDELDDELRFHLEMESEAHRARGLSPEDARRVALSELHVAQTREAVQLARAGWIGRLADGLRQDILYSIRTLRRSPAFTTMAVLVLALGIGINTAVFSVVSAVFFRPLPVRAPEELVYLYQVPSRSERPMVTGYHDLEFFDGHYDAAFSSMTAHWAMPTVVVTDEKAERVWGELVAANYFDVLGVKPARGRTFRPEEDDVSTPGNAVVISDDLWQRLFDREPNVIGRRVRLGSSFYEVIGVIGPEFTGITDPWQPSQYWVTATQFFGDGNPNRRPGGGLSMGVIGRLKPGVSIDQARPIVSAQSALMQRERMPRLATLPNWQPNRYVVFPAGEVRTPINPAAQVVPVRLASAVMVVVAIVLLIAAANIAGILLARGVTRTRELAVRQALGAGAFRLVRQLITENVVVAAAAGTTGLGLAWVFTTLYRAYTPARFAVDTTVDIRILFFTAAVSLGAGVLVGLAPALQVLKVNVVAVLGGGAGSGMTRRVRGRLRHGVVIPQVALSMTLLVVAGVHVRSLLGVEQRDLGYHTDDITVLGVGYSDPAEKVAPSAGTDARARFLEERARRSQEFFRRVSDRLKTVSVPGGLAMTNRLPVSGTNWPETFVSQEAFQSGAPTMTGALRANVTEGYFRTMGISLRQGRDFDDRDTLTSPRVAIVSETLARHLWPAGTALGRYVAPYSQDGPSGKIDWLEVVGVVSEVDPILHEAGQQPFVYLPFAQKWEPSAMQVVVRQSGDADALIKDVKAAVAGADSFAQVESVQTMEQITGEILYPRRAAAGILSIAGLVGVILAAIGLYGVIAYSVAQRMREIGIRSTLGADRRDILVLVLREGAIVTAIGAIPGFGASLLALRWTSTIVGTLPTVDVVTFTVVPVAMAAVVLLACYLPARRAARVDPMVVLRAQ
jgi:putative ABC transport system permease protein